MHKYIIALIVCASFFLAGVGAAADQPKPQGVSSYTDRELQLEFENLQLKIQQWGQAIKDAQDRLAEIQAEAKKRAEAKKAAPKVGTDAPKKGTE